MSDSDSDATRSSDVRIEKALRDAVTAFFKTDDLDSLTLKNVRSAAAQKLGLSDEFFKTDASWKERSKEIVKEEVNSQENASTQPESSPVVRSRASNTKDTARKAKPAPQLKRKPQAQNPPRAKRRKKTASASEDSGSELTPAPDEDEQPNIETPPKLREPPPQTTPSGQPSAAQDSDSDLSSLIDEAPPKPKRKPAQSSTTKPAKPSTSKGKSKHSSTADSKLSADEEEIKRLQGWLIKCGIRKVWGKELAKFDTPRDKISHLKDLLQDAGMQGRFSDEKARQIKEQRELKADLEAITAGNRAWGRGESDDEEAAGGRPRRRLAKGLQELQDLAGDEESD